MDKWNWNWRNWVLSAFFSGYAPVAPGTFGTLPAVAIHVLAGIGAVQWGWNVGWIMFVLAMIFLPIGIYVASWGEKESGIEDPGFVVIDEVVGYWITVAFMPFSWQAVVVGFLLFRAMDILKPFPAYQSQALTGGWGIMIDDVIAGIFANTLTRLILLLVGINF